MIATGVAPRSLARGQDLQGVFVLRTLDDALALRHALAAGKRLVVVGGGFLGLEVAATARQLGLEVEVIEPLPVCLEGPLGRTIGERVMHLQTTHGVRLRNGIGVRRLIGDQEQSNGGAVTAVELQDGSLLPADNVLVAIGAQPAIDWLADSGLTLQNGIVCNAFCEAAPDIYAAGDVANWYHPHLERHVRLEHRMNATEQGQAVARNILGERQPFAPMPFFWSDQCDVKLQMYGIASRGAELQIVEGALHEDRFVAAYYEAGEHLVAVLGWNSPKQLLSYFILLQHPELVAQLRTHPEQPDQLARAIEEILRVTPIGEGRPRITREPVQLGETTIPAGEVLFLVLHAANHDPSVFPDARAIRFDREMQPILSFGRGIHACLGQQIARMELQVLWQTLLTRLPSVHLAVPPSEVPWREADTLTFGPAHLPVTW